MKKEYENLTERLITDLEKEINSWRKLHRDYAIKEIQIADFERKTNKFLKEIKIEETMKMLKQNVFRGHSNMEIV